jgi:RimJ/RimL family protein N-acetyltransferase
VCTGHVTRTPHLLLRPLREADLAPLWEIHGDADAMRYTWCPATPEESARDLWAHEAQREKTGYAAWVAVLESEDRVIGWGGLFDDPFDPCWGPEVGYFLHHACWGRGFATEIVMAALAHGFDDVGLQTIGAFAKPANAASIRVLAKCGFSLLRYEPRLGRNHYVVHARRGGGRIPTVPRSR